MTSAYGAGATFRRPLTLIALVIGLFAMHGMALNPHAAHAAPATIAAASATTEVPTAGHPMAMPAATAVDERGDRSPVMVTGALCVAVLLALGLSLLVPRSRGLLVPVVEAAFRPSHARTAPPSRGPPRDLLAQLCVLRT